MSFRIVVSVVRQSFGMLQYILPEGVGRSLRELIEFSSKTRTEGYLQRARMCEVSSKAFPSLYIIIDC